MKHSKAHKAAAIMVNIFFAPGACKKAVFSNFTMPVGLFFTTPANSTPGRPVL